ncbi:MAG: hypothetical protein ACFCD0_07370 [Gemmataceae bacterium]
MNWKNIFGGCALVLGIAAVATSGITDYHENSCIPTVKPSRHQTFPQVSSRTNAHRNEIFQRVRGSQPNTVDTEIFMPRKVDERKEVIQIDPRIHRMCKAEVIDSNLVKSEVIPNDEEEGVVVRSDFGVDYEESEPAQIPPSSTRVQVTQNATISGWACIGTFGCSVQAALNQAVAKTLEAVVRPVQQTTDRMGWTFTEEQESPQEDETSSVPKKELEKFMYYDEQQGHHHGGCPYLNGHTPYCPPRYYRPFRSSNTTRGVSGTKPSTAPKSTNQQGESNEQANNKSSEKTTTTSNYEEGSWSGAWLYGEPSEPPQQEELEMIQNFPWHMLIPLSW